MSATALGNSLKRLLRQPAFLVAIVILGAAAAGLHAATGYLSLHFKKQPVPLRQPLKTVAATFGPWHQGSEDQILNHEMEDVLQTDKYIFREYLDERVVGRDVIKQFEGKAWDERQGMIRKLQTQYPDGVINCAVTFYTGAADTVAHIPDRCYVADGFEPVNPGTPTWQLAGPSDGRSVQVRFTTFEDQASNSRAIVRKNVAYFFNCNGEYIDDPLGVRVRLQDLRQRYGYYAKIELMTLVKDRDKAAAMMTDFLSHALPEIEKCFPDWEKVTRGGG
ncbi:MAG: exosortase-associated EpsI family protein [Tepidisphaeraceae bacterium]